MDEIQTSLLDFIWILFGFGRFHMDLFRPSGFHINNLRVEGFLKDHNHLFYLCNFIHILSFFSNFMWCCFSIRTLIFMH
jgi:hypothetical protein